MYRYYLQFENHLVREVEIFEPSGMDGATFSIEQKSNMFARDVFVFNEDIELEFTDSVFDISEPYYNIEGKQITHLGHSLDFIFDAVKTYGCEASVKFVIKENDVEFVAQSLDFENYQTDNKTYFKCKTIEDNKRSLHKIREDIKLDIYSSTDLDGNEITPLIPTKILLQSKPTVSSSEWNSKDTVNTTLYSNPDIGTRTENYYYNNAQNIVKSGIQDTLTFFDSVQDINEFNNGNAEDYRYLFAKNTLQNVKFKLSNFQIKQNNRLAVQLIS